jgi:hypothetical protein
LFYTNNPKVPPYINIRSKTFFEFDSFIKAIKVDLGVI